MIIQVVFSLRNEQGSLDQPNSLFIASKVRSAPLFDCKNRQFADCPLVIVGEDSPVGIGITCEQSGLTIPAFDPAYH